jgi:short-subunit dehydrogenase
MSLPSNQQRAIITGASSGIGKATALAFAKAGIHVALVSRSPDKLESVAIAARKIGVEARAYPLDLSQLEDLSSKMTAIAEDFGGIDILVNNAGIGYTNYLRDTSLKDWQKVINLNLTSIFQCVRGILPTMRERRRGTIINVVSIAAQSAFPAWGAYSVSKAGLVAFAKVLAAEEREWGIRVINITPGAVNTPIWETETVQADFDRASMLDPEIVASCILQATLLPAEAVVEDLILVSSAGKL